MTSLTEEHQDSPSDTICCDCLPNDIDRAAIRPRRGSLHPHLPMPTSARTVRTDDGENARQVKRVTDEDT